MAECGMLEASNSGPSMGETMTEDSLRMITSVTDGRQDAEIVARLEIYLSLGFVDRPTVEKTLTGTAWELQEDGSIRLRERDTGLSVERVPL